MARPAIRSYVVQMQAELAEMLENIGDPLAPQARALNLAENPPNTNVGRPLSLYYNTNRKRLDKFMSNGVVEAHIHRALLALADLAAS
jgi:hypothetical protein